MFYANSDNTVHAHNRCFYDVIMKKAYKRNSALARCSQRVSRARALGANCAYYDEQQRVFAADFNGESKNCQRQCCNLWLNPPLSWQNFVRDVTSNEAF